MTSRLLRSALSLIIAATGSATALVALSPAAQADDPNPAYVRTIGSPGSGPGQLDDPYGVAVDSAGNVYVADNGNHRIQKFSPTGTFLTQWGTRGTGNDNLWNPRLVAVDPSGNVWVGDDGNQRIQKFTSAGTYLATVGATYGTGDGQFKDVSGIAFDAAGNMYATDRQNHRVQKFSNAGDFISKFGTQGSGNGELNLPQGIDLDAAGNIYVADAANHRVQKFDPSGGYLTQWGVQGLDPGQFTYPKLLSLDPAGNVWVAEPDSHRLQKFTASGTRLLTWQPVGSGTGQFSFNYGLDFSATEMVVGDAGHHRVQVYTPGVATNAAPVIAEATPSITTTAGAAGTVNLTASDADSDPLTWSIQTQGTKGTATVPAGTGTAKTVTYTPDAATSGNDSFVVLVSDGQGGTDTVTVQVTITAPPANNVPSVGPESQAITVDAGASKTVNFDAVDSDGDPITWSIQTQGTKGTATIPAGPLTSNTATYTANAGTSGSDSFVVQVADGRGGTDTATVTLTINPAPQPPAPQPITGLTATASGGTRVGEVRIASTSYDNDTTVAKNYQWQVAGTGGTWLNIAGATARELELPPSVMNINVRVVVLASRAGASATAASAPLVILPGNHNASKLKITGKKAVGKKLKAKVKIPKKAAGLRITYSWTVVGTTIRLSGKSIKVPARAVGKQIFLDIRITAPGYHNQELRSSRVTIRS